MLKETNLFDDVFKTTVLAKLIVMHEAIGSCVIPEVLLTITLEYLIKNGMINIYYNTYNCLI